ncbi:hypothetical protein HP456_16405 [Bacillus haikouensis]|uniref:hypothetical protein n=1 Tax=Bacillus haikouensis TaxID=1510468 RepID=UPI001551AC8C|nr:hypothetical protein [Bacillus haikouensis]NQD67497.1 hypothetical protein [Bacillus haikouensis]
MKKLIQSVLLLQVLWFVMFFTNFLGFLGSRSELWQDIVWLGIPAISIIISLVFLIRKRFPVLTIMTIALSLLIISFWLLISGISQM